MNLRRIGLGILCLLLAGGVCFFALRPEPAEAGFTSEEVDDLVSFLGGDAAFNRKLMALDALRKKADVEDKLEALAEGKDVKLAVFTTTALGKMKTAAAKSNLKDLVKSTTLSKDVRKSAMTAIAVHFKDSSDLTFLESETASDSDLKAYCAWLKTNVYGK